MYRSIFKFVLAALVIYGCSDLGRDNLLDPKNENSYSDSPVLIEAFVNSELNYNEAALDALNEIENTYQDEVVIIEYHREIVVNENTVNDDYSNTIFSGLHESYVNAYLNYPRAIPDIYLNGSGGRVLGASSAASVVDRIEDILPDLLNEHSDYRIEVEMETAGDDLNIDYKIARLGKQSAGGLQLQVILIRNFGSPHAQRVVQYINYPVPETVAPIKSGEYTEGTLTLDLRELEDKPQSAVFKIVQNDNIRVLHTYKKEIEW